MKLLSLLFALSVLASGCIQAGSQKITDDNKNKKKIGGPCEGCEAIYETLTPFMDLNEVDTLADFNKGGQRLEVSGTIYKRDGKTPAPDVVLYIYHTDKTGRYPMRGDEKGWARRHGYLRGWIKTNKQGQYRFYTARPGAYPGGGNPAHIHATIKEAGKGEYYIDDFLFEGDPYLTTAERERLQQRGGNGIVKAEHKCDRLVATRSIILGLNVPDYPAQ